MDNVEDDAYVEEDHIAVVEVDDDSDVAHIGDDVHTDLGRSHLAFVEAEALPIQAQVLVDTVRRDFGEEVQHDVVVVVEYDEAGAAHSEVEAEEPDDAIAGRKDDDADVEVEVGEIEHELEVEGVEGVEVDCALALALAESGVVEVVAKAAARKYEPDNARDFSAPHWHWH